LRGATAEEKEKGPFKMPIDSISSWIADFEWIRQHFGLLAAISLIVAGFSVIVWWKWEDIANRPGVAWGTRAIHLLIEPLPKATAGHLSIAVAHLAHDTN